MKKSPIFRQLLLKVILPVIAVFIVSAYLIVRNEIRNFKAMHEEKNKDIAENIYNILQSQDYDLELVESIILNQRIEDKSKLLVDEHLLGIKNIKSINLDSVAEIIGLKAELEDIYIIDRKGVIINTTYDADAGLKTFELFGEEFKKYIEKRFDNRDFDSPKATPESETGKLRKFSYQSTRDGKYIVELGFRSTKANEIVGRTNDKLNRMALKQQSIQSVDLFVGVGDPVSLNNKKAKIKPEHMEIFNEVLLYKNSILSDPKGAEGYTDAHTAFTYENGKRVQYLFSYMPRENTTLYGDSVIRIVSDYSRLDGIIMDAIINYSLIFGVIIILLIVVILFVTRSITNPLNKLVDKVNKISAGNLNERAEEKGAKEIYTLAQHFNTMLDDLEESYNTLEQKVIERTAEISQQKEEIEAQRDQIEGQRDNLAKSNKELEIAYRNIEEQKSNIEDSIHYAKRIQTAILPTSKQIYESFKDHFVLYKPKDIVSGDFYWSARKGNKDIFVVADCTGHGVPGAFMSMIGNTLLNKIVNTNNITKPNEVLDNLRDEVIKSLNQKGSDHESKDGMDVVYCSIDQKKMTVDFAGANNPLFLVRNGELHIYKGDKQPVGYFIAGIRPFTNHHIKVQKGDQIYLFTDGYQDQFGGDHDRKFMTKNFKALLTDIADNDSSEQKEKLDNTIENWMVNSRQIDDILVVGIKIK